MLRHVVILLSTLSLTAVVRSADVRGSILWNGVCRSLSDLHPQTRVVLDGGLRNALVTEDGSFTLWDVEPGTYVLDVLASDHVFDQLRVDVHPPAASASPESVEVEVRPLPPGTPHYPNPPLPILPYPITLEASRKKLYTTPKQSFNLIGMFQNPMMLLMVFTGVMVFVMPKMMANMDPDVAKEVKERQDKFFNIGNKIQGADIGGGIANLLGGSGAEEEKAAAPATPNAKRGKKRK